METLDFFLSFFVVRLCYLDEVVCFDIAITSSGCAKYWNVQLFTYKCVYCIYAIKFDECCLF